MIYRLAVTLHDNRVLTDFAADELSGLAWMENDHYYGHYPKNLFNNQGCQFPWDVRHVSITGSEPPTKARASWYRKYRS